MTLDNISFSYPGVRLFDDFTVSFKDFKASAVMGESGCGKTTLLDLIAGLKKPIKGSVRLCDGDYGGKARQNNGALRVGYAFSRPIFFPYFSVGKNLKEACYGAYMAEDRIRQGLECLEILDLSPKRPHELSAGQIQRVSLVRAFACDPTIALLDEPCEHLDGRIKALCRRYIRSNSKGRTVIIATHDTEEAAELADFCYVLSGRPCVIANVQNEFGKSLE